MAWSDRRYSSREPSWGPRQPQDAVFWLLGITIGLHVLKVLLSGMDVLDSARDTTFEQWLGVSAEGIGKGRLWQVLTYPLVHGGVRHLCWYMLILFFAGRILEGIVGTRRFLGLYVACAAGGALGAFLHDQPGQPTIGAGGSIMGVLTILLVLAPNLPVNLIFFMLRLKWVVFVLVAIDFCFAVGGPVILDDPSPSYYWTPLLGAVTGFGGIWVWPRVLRPRVEQLRQRLDRRREVDEIERSLHDEKELDRILDKITRQGMGSLTERERRFLKRASTRYHGSRRS
jgi:membrane associated rhomboid family serine protease